MWPEPAHDAHAGRLVLWVGYEDMNKARQAPWPLAKSGTADVFRPIPFGTDQRGRIVYLRADLRVDADRRDAAPRQDHGDAGAAARPGPGPDVQLRVFELKGTGDLSALEKVAHEYGTGQHDETIAAVLASLRQLLHEELPRRTKTIAGLPRDLAPENKVTPDLAAKQSLGLFPIVFVRRRVPGTVHPPALRQRGRRAVPAADQTRPGRRHHPDAGHAAAGQGLPAHRASRANVGIRFCLRVMDQIANDMILGTSRYKTGIRATTFTARDKGIGYLVGASDDPQIMRSFYLDGPAADKIGDRARALRLAKRRADRPRRRPAHRPRTRPGLLAARRPRRRHGQRPATVVGHDPGPARRPAPGRLLRLDRGPARRRLQAARRADPQVWAQVEGGGNGNRRGITRADLHKALGAAERRRELPPADRHHRPTPSTTTPDEEGGERSA